MQSCSVVNPRALIRPLLCCSLCEVDVEQQLREHLKLALQFWIAVLAHRTSLAEFELAAMCAIAVVDLAIHHARVSAEIAQQKRWLFLRRRKGFTDMSLGSECGCGEWPSNVTGDWSQIENHASGAGFTTYDSIAWSVG